MTPLKDKDAIKTISCVVAILLAAPLAHLAMVRLAVIFVGCG